MGPEINIDSILALEKRIEEGLGDVIQLKRARNSLLNISTRVPPELLGQVFRWNAIPDDRGDLEIGSYNFLLVCNHWFEVASSTPELWTYWGNTPKLWLQRYQRSGGAPLDLVLRTHTYVSEGSVLDASLRDALRDHAQRDSVRSIHILGGPTDLQRSVISSLIPNGENIRDNSIESLRVEYTTLDISSFLARYRFPKLRDLRLITTATISSWDHLKLPGAPLTTLSLEFIQSSSRPTTSQLLSILTLYPNLQDLLLRETMIPHDSGDGLLTFRAPLRCLKKLRLTGACCHVFQLLQQLEYPDTLDSVELHLLECGGKASEFLGSYLLNRIRRDDRFQGRLGVQVSCGPYSSSYGISAVGKFNIPGMVPGHGYPSVSLSSGSRDKLPQGAGEKLCINLIALTPRKRVVGFIGVLDTHAMRDLLIIMPNIENLYLPGPMDFDMFLRPDPLSNKKLLPSLRRLCLDSFTIRNGNGWRPLIAYLSHRMSGGQAVSIRLCGEYYPVPPEVVEEIKGIVKEFNLGYHGGHEWY